jgi:hypothetical protein
VWTTIFIEVKLGGAREGPDGMRSFGKRAQHEPHCTPGAYNLYHL